MKIMIISDSPRCQTGYGRQVRDLHRMFKQLGHETVFIGMHAGIENTEVQEYEGSKVYAMKGPLDPSPLGRWEGYERHWLQQSVLKEEPDLIIMVWDMRKILGIIRDFDRFFRCPIYVYWLFDSDPISYQYAEHMKNTRVKILPVTQCISRWMHDLGIEYDWKPIPEPVDLAKFFPMPNDTRERLKITYLGENAGKVCFGFVGGNFQRKNIPFLIDAFAALPKEIRDDSVLFLHTDPTAHKRNPMSYDLHAIIEAYHPELKDKIIFSQSNNDLSFNMCEIYNVMDWQVSGAHGEGWGLATVEGMACGIPMIIGDISTSEEILGEVGFRVPIGGYIYTTSPYLRITVPDFETFVAAMVEGYTYVRSPDPSVKFPEWDIRSKSPKSIGGFTAHVTGCIKRAELFSIDNIREMWKEFFEYLELIKPPGEFLGWKKELIDEPVVIQSNTKEPSNV